MSVLGMVAWAAAAVSLWLGAARSHGAVARAFRWLAAAAVLYCASLILNQVLGTLNPVSGLSPDDLPPLLALALAGVGIAVLAGAGRDGEGPPGPERSAGTTANQATERAGGASGAPVLPGLADGYVLAVALLVIGWITIFSGEFHRSGERPGTFLLALIHPLADLALLGVLLPMVTAAWRRVALPYLGVGAVAVADALAVGQRVAGGHPGVAAGLFTALAAVLVGVVPWRPSGVGWGRRSSGVTAATIVAALAAAAATLVVIINGLAGGPASDAALIVAGGAGVLVLAARIFMLVAENGVILGVWRESSRNLRDLAERSGDIVVICDPAGIIRSASEAVADFGYTPSALTGRPVLDFVHPEDRVAALAAVRLAQGEPGQAEGRGYTGRFPVRVRAADGTWRHVESTVLPYQAPGEPSQLMVAVRDVSDQVALRQQVTHLTFHDGLTGLPNRAYVEERVRDVLAGPDAAAGVASRTGVIFLDLDRFTAVNDSVGHGAGDLVLAQAARRLRAVVPVHNTVARWGSDEFAVLAENAAGAAEITEIAERMARAIAAEPFQAAGQPIALTASVGVALADADPGSPAGHVLRNADVAMSRAKDAGGDRVEVYAAHMHADVIRRLEIVTDLQRALRQGELSLQYQPVVELAGSRVVGAEALVRWWRGDKVVGPRDFLEAAEESGLIVGVGEWVLREACAQAAAWRRSDPDLGISVNVSARQLAAPGFAARVADILAETGLPAPALTVEVNERTLAEDDGLIAGRLTDLHRMGVRMAIDDFGTGYASLANLRHLPVEEIKIDPSFVAGLGNDDTLALLTRTVVQLGHALRLRVVAEGIEQPHQLIALREMGCGYGQGFAVAMPTSAAGIEDLIRGPGPVVPRVPEPADRDLDQPSVSDCETTRVSG